MVYIDEYIIFIRDSFCIDFLIRLIFEGSKSFIITQKLTIDKYIGVEVINNHDDAHEFLYPSIVSIFLQIINISDKAMKYKVIPMGFPVLCEDLSSVSSCKI